MERVRLKVGAKSILRITDLDNDIVEMLKKDRINRLVAGGL